jgi:hypothetical protein
MNASDISDNDLILYFYKDGLGDERIAQIDAALLASAPLQRRYAALQDMLGAVDTLPAAEPDAGFTQRIWTRLEPRLAPRRAPRRRFEPFATLLQALLSPRFALAAAALLAVAVGIGYYAGRRSANDDAGGNAMAARVLDAYVADHLRATEGLLLTAANSDSAELRAGNRDLAATLVDSNRLYAAAAARAGNTRLAEFLRQLEPVLIDLANQPADAPVEARDGLRDYLRKTDLLFQVRATQARIETAGKHRT